MNATQLSAGIWSVTDDAGASYTVHVPRSDDTAEKAISTLVEAQAGPTAADLAQDRVARIKAECSRRILAVADDYAQMNLTGAAAAGALTAEQMATYQAAVQWIGAMRAACADIIADADLDPADDANWPTPSADIVALAAAF